MQALFLISDESLARAARTCAENAGYSCIAYSDPVKAADNIREIRPDVFAVSTDDFPLHFELLASIVRTGDFSGTRAFFLTGSAPVPTEVETTARMLGVEGCYSDLAANVETKRAFFSRLSAINTDIITSRIDSCGAGSRADIYLMFSHPATFTPVSCRISSISAQGAVVRPDNADLASDIKSGDIIPDCSLLVGGRHIASSCVVESARGKLGLIFDGMDIRDKAYLVAYIENSAKTDNLRCC